MACVFIVIIQAVLLAVGWLYTQMLCGSESYELSALEIFFMLIHILSICYAYILYTYIHARHALGVRRTTEEGRRRSSAEDLCEFMILMGFVTYVCKRSVASSK
jgi:hypothetical protein